MFEFTRNEHYYVRGPISYRVSEAEFKKHYDISEETGNLNGLRTGSVIIADVIKMSKDGFEVLEKNCQVRSEGLEKLTVYWNT
jgi:hypothetical protein